MMARVFVLFLVVGLAAAANQALSEAAPQTQDAHPKQESTTSVTSPTPNAPPQNETPASPALPIPPPATAATPTQSPPTVETEPTQAPTSEPKASDKTPHDPGHHSSTQAPAPSLAGQALREELRRHSDARQTELSRLTAERLALEEERKKLAKLAEDVARAREALREETARLENLLQRLPSSTSAPGPSSKSPKPEESTVPQPSAESRRIETLAKAVRGMKPTDAAAMLSKVDRRLASEILRRMKASDASEVLGKLEPEIAAELVTDFAKREGTR